MRRLLRGTTAEASMQSDPEHATAIYVARENVARFRKLASGPSNTADNTRLLALLREEEARLTALTSLQKVFQPPRTKV